LVGRALNVSVAYRSDSNEPRWRPVGSGNSRKPHPTLEADLGTWQVIVSWQSCPRFITCHAFGRLYKFKVLYFNQHARMQLRAFASRFLSRAWLHVELVANRNAYPSRGQPLCCACDLHHASVSAGKASPSQSEACCKSHAHHTRVALRHGTTRQDVKASLS
jgi:hypothetical protein